MFARRCWVPLSIFQCPSVEPVVNLYMRICFTCRNMLVAHQEKSFTLSHVTVSPDYKKCEQIILDIHQETQNMKANIQRQLPQVSHKDWGWCRCLLEAGVRPPLTTPFPLNCPKLTESQVHWLRFQPVDEAFVPVLPDGICNLGIYSCIKE